jgi:hypothetical protein
MGVQSIKAKKKPMWRMTQKVIRHIGLLANEPPLYARVALYLVVRRLKMFDSS